MNAMPLPADYSPDDRRDTYRYGDYVPPSPQEQAQIDAHVAALERPMETTDCAICGAVCLCVTICLPHCNLDVCSDCLQDILEELEGLSVGVAA